MWTSFRRSRAFIDNCSLQEEALNPDIHYVPALISTSALSDEGFAQNERVFPRPLQPDNSAISAFLLTLARTTAVSNTLTRSSALTATVTSSYIHVWPVSTHVGVDRINIGMILKPQTAQASISIELAHHPFTRSSLQNTF